MPETERYSQEHALEEAMSMKDLVDTGQASSYAEAEAKVTHEPIERQREFERITRPEELLSFMADNINYGYVGRNGKVYGPGSPEKESDFGQEYFLQSPEELLASGYGVCWDSVELERDWFLKHGYQPETYFMMYAKTGGTRLPTHTFIVYEENGAWCWFEHAFAAQRGIHKYASRDELLDDVKQKQQQYVVAHRGASPDDLERLRLSTYDQPDFGASPQEFVAKIVEQNQKRITKE